MLKKDFVSLILGTIGGLMFSLGMCMVLLPEWNAFREGVVMCAVGLIILLAMVLIRRKMEGKAIIVRLTRRTVGAIVLGIIGSLAFGAGLCMIMVWNRLFAGILVGIAGIVILLCMIPVLKGLK